MLQNRSLAGAIAPIPYAAPDDAERARQAGLDAPLARPPDPEKRAAVLAGTPRAAS